MAKRKRLTPANPSFLDAGPAPERKSMLSAQAPIADVARDASATAALSEMSDTLARARSEGRMVITIPLGQIELDHLIRDRVVVEEDAMETLMASLAERGQQTPIEVTPLGPDRYGLISGWRRCNALARLAAKQGDAAPTVEALLRHPDEASDAYLAMVEENEIRVDLSYFERARIVLKAVDQGVFPSERTALQDLFRAASRAKRSKIGSFLPVVRAVEDVIRFPQALSERLGLAISQALGTHPHLKDRLRKALIQTKPDTPEAETKLLANVLATVTQAGKPDTPPAFRDETVGAFTLRTHRDGSVTVQGAAVSDPLLRDLRGLLQRYST